MVTSTTSRIRATCATREQQNTTNLHHRPLGTMSPAAASQSVERLLDHGLPTSTNPPIAPAVAATPGRLPKSSMVVDDGL